MDADLPYYNREDGDSSAKEVSLLTSMHRVLKMEIDKL
jgi:hypothetical protein